MNCDWALKHLNAEAKTDLQKMKKKKNVTRLLNRVLTFFCCGLNMEVMEQMGEIGGKRVIRNLYKN